MADDKSVLVDGFLIPQSELDKLPVGKTFSVGPAKTDAPMRIRFDEPSIDLPDSYADIQAQIGAAIEQLRAWYPDHYIKVAPVFSSLDGRIDLRWELCVIAREGTRDYGRHPYSYDRRTLAEAVADLKQQQKRYFDAEKVNAELSAAADEIRDLQIDTMLYDAERPHYSYRQEGDHE